ncbi:hypothetical protein AUEXF2481DRAFT_36900 [Aureobasidium subglaciale EXF-2481]|uniref:Uncharacterized protein n=1 Tax=Aureobasidium subglaciale (strain EXF-2481) TaxID=1043005 RepID=A0A074YKM8_AURSE|nr:uncharacterized protein AUEXF2481DRAFT_36900 [Aureobasidium subglaciale EXF-2481]KEQ98388.1 hypothetical protein AUEXF2481DRAFT_36900 [Aureobasidium subglaciale EXF-2481]
MEDEFAREVLRLAEGQTVEDFEKDLTSQARSLDINTTLPEDAQKIKNPNATSSLTSSTHPRRSISTGSQASHSTDFTDASRISRDCPHARPRPTRGRRSSGTSVSIKDYDSIVNHARFDFRRSSFNFATSPIISPSPSTFSLSSVWSRSRESSPKRHIITRGLSRLRLRRIDSGDSTREKDDCPHCPQSGSRHRRTLHTLSCGHRYCALALRKMIKDSLNEESIPPTCCKRPIPGSLVASVMSQDEQDALMNMLVAWDDDATTTPPIHEAGVTSHPTSFVKSRSQSRSPALGAERPLPDETEKNLEKAMEIPSFRDLRQQQERQRDDLTAWAKRKRQGFIDGYAVRKLQLLPYFDRQKDQLVEKQTAAIARIEDKHVIDEHEMREEHEVETRNNAIALKHMEAYCRGETTSGDRHERAVTDRDLAELTKARRARDQMDAKHAGAISVLRGEQTRRISQRLVKQEEELSELESRQLKELESLQRECDDMVREWDAETQKRRAKLERWWNLQTEIWRKELDRETGVQFTGDLPSIRWPCIDTNKNNRRRDPTKRHTIAVSPAPGLQPDASRAPRSVSPARKPHRFSTAFTIRGGMISQA